MIWATPEKRVRLTWKLFLISFLSLYSELIVIRWLASEIRVFAYFKNLPLMASFLGLGLGCARYRSPRRLFPWFPWLFGLLCLLPAFAEPLDLVRLQFPDQSIFLWSAEATLPIFLGLKFVGIILGISSSPWRALPPWERESASCWMHSRPSLPIRSMWRGVCWESWPFQASPLPAGHQ